jgi:hypothetical protein
MEGYNPLPGLDEPLTPQNMSVGADHGDDDDDEGKPVQTPARKDEDRETEARLQQLLRANAARLARRAASAIEKGRGLEAFNDGFADLVAETLAVPRAAAEAWCASAQDKQVKEPFCADFEAWCLASLTALAAGAQQ